MINLLNANFIRLRKNKIFWILTIFSIGVSLCIVFAQYHQMIKYGDEIQVAQLLLNYSTLAGVVIAIFTSLFVGVEYSDGGIRNKIIIGHKRINIYLSSLVTNMIISIFYYILYMIMIVSLGIPLFGIGTVPISIILTKILIIFVIMMAYCSIFTFIAMLCSNKTITAIVTIIFAFGLMILGLFCYEILGTPRYTETATIVDGETKIENKNRKK